MAFLVAPVIERVRRRQYHRRPRVFRDRTNPLETLSDDEVLCRLRLPREVIFRLCGELVQLDPLGRRGGSLPVSIQLCITLRYLATGSFQDMVGELHGVSQPTVSRTLQKVITGLIELLPDYIRPPSEAEVRQSKVEFFARGGLPGVFAAVDGTHVRLWEPKPAALAYMNRKGFHSINVMIVCDAKYQILDVKANSPGSFHDARILRESPFFEAMENGQIDGLVLGDSAYPLRPWLLTPFRAPGNRQQERYNVGHARERVVVENTIGILKKRWHILHVGLKLSPGRSSRAILACAVLHNVAQAVGLPPPDEELDAQEVDPDPEGDVGPLNARALREHIATHHF